MIEALGVVDDRLSAPQSFIGFDHHCPAWNIRSSLTYQWSQVYSMVSCALMNALLVLRALDFQIPRKLACLLLVSAVWLAGYTQHQRSPTISVLFCFTQHLLYLWNFVVLAAKFGQIHSEIICR
jgi:hypothetical protein